MFNKQFGFHLKKLTTNKQNQAIKIIDGIKFVKIGSNLQRKIFSEWLVTIYVCGKTGFMWSYCMLENSLFCIWWCLLVWYGVVWSMRIPACSEPEHILSVFFIDPLTSKSNISRLFLVNYRRIRCEFVKFELKYKNNWI